MAVAQAPASGAGGILIAGRSGDEERETARALLDHVAGFCGPIAVPLLLPSGTDGMAAVAEHDRTNRAVTAPRGEDRHGRLGGGQPGAIVGEAGGRDAIVE